MKVSLIIFFIGFLTIAPSIFIGIKYFDGKVTEQPYETGLKYDENKHLIEKAGIKLYSLNQNRNGQVVTLQFILEKKSEVKFDKLSFYLSRPANSEINEKLDVKAVDEGVYEALLTLNSEGYYLLIAKGEIGNKSFALQKSIYIK